MNNLFCANSFQQSPSYLRQATSMVQDGAQDNSY